MGGVMRSAAIAAVLLACVVRVQADDVDGDGVDGAFDVCDNTPPGAAVDAEGRPLGDIDLDCDTDIFDFALLQRGFTGAIAPPGVAIQTVRVVDPDNQGELSGKGAGGAGADRICGAVDYVYNMGTFEVTAGQYTEFLNAVADADPYGLYNADMWSDSRGCKIERTGSSPNYIYTVAADQSRRPVNFVSWGDAVRFANWLHNGQPTGAQDWSSTEDGSYFLDGATNDTGLMGVVREADATWVIPSEDEWYKAAYYDGGTDAYYDYPTSSNSVPGYVDDSGLLSGTGEAFTEGGADPGNYATNDNDSGTGGIGSPFYRTQVGEWERSASPSGTFDQGGNVWEWNEAMFGDWSRGLRGGAFDAADGSMLAANRISGHPSREYADVGLRVAVIPSAQDNRAAGLRASARGR